MNRKYDKQVFLLKCIHCYSIFRMKWCDKLFKIYLNYLWKCFAFYFLVLLVGLDMNQVKSILGFKYEILSFFVKFVLWLTMVYYFGTNCQANNFLGLSHWKSIALIIYYPFRHVGNHLPLINWTLMKAPL